MEHNLIQAYRITIEGAVQGVGFRPFVFRLGRELGLDGFVCNSPSGVTVVAEGRKNDLESFLAKLSREAPAPAKIHQIRYFSVPVREYRDFVIKDSETGTPPNTIALPDLALCDDCRVEIFDPGNRRFLYPFTNCVHCGPRYSIMESLPYDRERTSMKDFVMCPDCAAEFDDPHDRRFHAQPNACPKCGPFLELWSANGFFLEKHGQALKNAVEFLRSGKILALKGLGGFQLLVDARQDSAVERLRLRKNREGKPFALLFPTLDSVRKVCEVSETEMNVLLSPQSPIVLLSKIPGEKIFQAAVPGNPYLGAMLPYTPLHSLLMAEFGSPLVATSGNISDEPICIDEKEAVQRLGAVADFFLVHNRPIIRPMDDSVVRVIKDKTCVLRRARGYAPMPICVEDDHFAVFGMGGHYKNSIAVKVKKNIFLSQHIGDLQTAGSLGAFRNAVNDLRDFYAQGDMTYSCDLHPDYFSTRFAKSSVQDVFFVQHHHGHIVAGMAEHGIKKEVLGLAWDGTGLGDDGTIWGGEFLLCTVENYERFGHLRTFRLPGGDAASRHPHKIALGILYELTGGIFEEYDDLSCFLGYSQQDQKILGQMLARKMNCPLTSSMGRLFDGVSSLVGLCQHSAFEGQAAMMLEYALAHERGDERYYCDVRETKSPSGPKYIFDWGQMIRDVIKDVRLKVRPARISLKFHNTLVDLGVGIARRAGRKDVVLSGGCFQNKFLLEKLYDSLREEGFCVCFPQQVPVNDGGLALGQVMVAVGRMKMNANQ